MVAIAVVGSAVVIPRPARYSTTSPVSTERVWPRPRRPSTGPPWPFLSCAERMTGSTAAWRWDVEDRIALVEALFTAWSSGDPDAPRQYLTEDAVLDDVIGGVHRGWPAIRAYFARGLASWPDLRLQPTGEWWSRDDGLAFTWVMSATVSDDR